MTIVTGPVPGLGDLPTESRMIATPWSRLVRGIGLGQHPVEHDPRIAAHLRLALRLLADRVGPTHTYTVFACRLGNLVLDVVDPAVGAGRGRVERSLGPVVAAMRAERNPYWRLMAATILIDAVAKLGLDPSLLVDGELDVPGEALTALDEIRPDRIGDENAGRHGDYEKLSAFSAVFLAVGQLGVQDRLVSGARDYVRESLEVLDRVPAPFFRGRGGSMLFSAISLLGYGDRIIGGGRDHLGEVLDHLDRADELNSPPAFPQRMSDAFPKVYPLLTMLNAIAMSGRAEYLTRGRDRLAEARSLLAATTPVERTHMGLYYLVALHNLGRTADQVPDLDAFVEELVGTWRSIDPGENYFLHGISYPYLIETALLTGRLDLVPPAALDRLTDAFPALDRSDADRANRPYPFSYALTTLGEIGQGERMFTERARYGNRSPLAWTVERLSPGGRAEGSRLHMLDHALINYALRLRGGDRAQTPLYRRFRFRLAADAVDRPADPPVDGAGDHVPGR